MSELLPYQLQGAEWLAGQERAILGDHMGLGKTPQAIRAADLVAARRVAVVCPAIGRINWRREFDRWSLQGPELFIESYDRLATQKKAREEFRRFRPDTVIADEFHYLKTRESKRTRTMYGQHCHGNGLFMIPKRVWMLSGTPAPNHVGELWTHLRAEWPELIQLNGNPLPYMEFLQRYAEWEQTEFGVKVFGNKQSALPELRGILDGIMLRRKGEQVLRDLPPIFWQPTYVIESETASAELRRLEQSPEVAELRRVLEAADEGATRALFVAEEPIAMASVRRLTAELKARPVGKLIAEELADGAYDKIVIFAHHLAALDILREELAPFSPCEIRGGQTERSRQAEIDAFQSDPKRRAMLVQQKAGYHTITLHAAAQVAFLEQSWTPDENVQAAKRCHRFGQTRPVFVRNFGLAGSIDDAVSQVLSRKAQAILELME
jgi:SNF2 family DNA or RNA helicase